MFKRLVSAVFFVAVVLTVASCQGDRVVAVYDDAGQMIRCITLGASDHADVPDGEKRTIIVKNGDWGTAYAKLGVTRDQCVSVSGKNPITVERPQ